MANWFVDTGLATGANDGTSMDNAWQSIKTALEYASFGVADTCWIRRRSSFASASANITVTDDGTDSGVLRFIGWPRAQLAIASSDWTNGDATVTVDDANMDREAHQARYIIAPDGKRYLITKVTSTTSIEIDRPYPGSTVSNDATAYIEADDFYATAQAIDDSAWTIKKSNWNADADTLPVIDFEATSYYINTAGALYTEYYHLEVKGGTDVSYGTWRCNGTGSPFAIVGCLFSQTNNTTCIYPIDGTLKRCTFEGNATGTYQRLVLLGHGSRLYDCAIYNAGDNGLSINGSNIYLENLNVGVEAANVDDDILLNLTGAIVFGIDVKLGGTNGTILSGGFIHSKIYIENYGKVAGANISSIGGGSYTLTKTAVVAGSGDPYKRTGGSDNVIRVDGLSTSVSDRAQLKQEPCLFEYTLPVDTTPRTYRLYLQTTSIATLTKCYLEAFYIDSYDDSSTYHSTVVTSDETVSERSGADDWSQYVEVTVQPAVASNVKIRFFAAWADSDGILYIDPLVEIS